MIKKILMLIFSIKKLGLKLGWIYFCCYLKALKDPNFVLEWADACEKQARKLEFFDPEDMEAIACRSWAKELRNCHEKINKFSPETD